MEDEPDTRREWETVSGTIALRSHCMLVEKMSRLADWHGWRLGGVTGRLVSIGVVKHSGVPE